MLPASVPSVKAGELLVSVSLTSQRRMPLAPASQVWLGKQVDAIPTQGRGRLYLSTSLQRI